MSSQKSDDRRQLVFAERRISHNNTRQLRSINENPLSTVQLRLTHQTQSGTTTTGHPSTHSLKAGHKNAQSKTSTNLTVPGGQSGAQKSQRSFLTAAASR